MKPSSIICRRLAGGLALILTTAAVGAAEPAAAPDFVVSSDGASVVDQRTQLAWSRCVEGMQWNGETCVGQPVLASHAQAIALAAARRKADGLAWRLPRVAELQRLVHKNANPPGLDPKLFPAAPNGWHWTMTANINTRGAAVNQYNYGNIMRGRTSANANQMAVLYGWAVNLETGEARDDVSKRTELPVRLVRQ